MPLDADRIAAVLLEGCKALIAKAVAPLREENDGLRSLADSLTARVLELEGRPIPALVTERALTMADVEAIKASWDDRHGEFAAKVEQAITLAEEARSAAVAVPEPPSIPDVPALVAEAVKAAVDALPPPQDGKDADPAEIAAIRDEIADVKASIPAAPDLSGFTTLDVVAGMLASGITRLKSETEETLDRFAMKEEVEAAIAGIPSPKDYGPEIEAVKAAIPTLPEPMDTSAFATKTEIAEAVEAIRLPDPVPGKEGRGIADVKLNDDREVIVKYTDGETKNLGSFDGLGFDDLSVEDGEREFTVVFARGAEVKRFPLSKDVVIDRGIWKEGSGYVRGDGLTYAGDYWIAQEPTTSRPGTDKTWRLAVRKGRDAKPVTR